MSERETGKTPSRWDPFAEFDSLEGFPFRRLPRRGVLERASTAELMPAVDVAENDTEYVVTAELPGTKKEDVTVEIHDNVLTVRGEKRNEREEKKEHRRYVERSYGTFSRSFTLPPNANGDKIVASFNEGVLSITIPKAEDAKPRAVTIKS